MLALFAPATFFRRRLSAPGRRTPQARFWLIVIALTLLAGGLRLWGVESRSLWQDEVFTASSATGNRLFEATILPDAYRLDPPDASAPAYYRHLAMGWRPWSAFVDGIAHNVQTPLYPTLMRLWMRLFGPDPVRARFFSVLCGILCIPAMAWLGRLAGGNRLGLAACAILTLSGFQIIYSQTARLYPLLTLLVLLGAALTLVIAQRCQRDSAVARIKWGTWAIWAALQVAGLYTHYFYVFALAFQILWLWRATRDDRRARIALIGACAATAAAAACWAPMWLRQQAFLANIGHGSLSGLWRPLTLIERLWKLGAELVSPKSVWIQLWVSAIVLASGAFACWGRLRKQPLAQILQNTPAWLRFSALWLACVVGGLLAVDLISNTHRIFSSRYLILASPALYLLIAGATLSLPRRAARVAGVTLAALMALNAGAVLSGEKFLRKEDYRGAGQYIARHRASGDITLACHSAVHAAGLAYYLPESMPLAGVSRRNAGVDWPPEALQERLKTLLKGRSGAFLALCHCRPALAERLRRGIEAQGFRLADRVTLSSMQALRYVRVPSTSGSDYRRRETPRSDRP